MKKQLMITLSLLFTSIMRISSGNSASSVPALYVLGDSIFDSGNNNFLLTIAKANFKPYGMNFQGGRATGRYTNGKTVVDFIAEYLGLPYAPPYMSLIRAVLQSGQLTGINLGLIRPVLQPDQLTGINFGSGSCGILPNTGQLYGKCLNIVDQVDDFEKLVKNELPKYYPNFAELSNYLSRSLFAVSIGSNDYINNYLDPLLNSSKLYTPQAFAQLLVSDLSIQFQRLYDLGARKVIMFEIGPIGCIPSITRRFKHNGQCAEEINNYIVLFNEYLAPMLVNLTSTNEGSDFILGRGYSVGYDAAIRPSNYGLTDVINPCCVALLNGTSGCIPEFSLLACKDPEKHYFWDGYHPTETVYKTLATRCINDSSFCVPKSINELVLQA